MTQNEKVIEIILGEANKRKMKIQVDLVFNSWSETCLVIRKLSKNTIPFHGPFHGRKSAFLIQILLGTEVSAADLIEVMDGASNMAIYVLYGSLDQGRSFSFFLENKKIAHSRKEIKGNHAVVVTWIRSQES